MAKRIGKAIAEKKAPMATLSGLVGIALPDQQIPQRPLPTAIFTTMRIIGRRLPSPE